MDMLSEDSANDIIPGLSCVLERLCARNDQFPPPEVASNFHALCPPSISIENYLVRLGKYAGCTGKSFVLSLIYIDRIIQGNPTFIVNSLNIHRLLISSVMLAAKFFEDNYFNNAYFAKVGGVPCSEMNTLEIDFLYKIDFALFITPDIYNHYKNELINHAQNSHCGCRNKEKIPRFRVPVPSLSPRGLHAFTKGHGSRSPGPLPIATHERLLKPMTEIEKNKNNQDIKLNGNGTTASTNLFTAAMKTSTMKTSTMKTSTMKTSTMETSTMETSTMKSSPMKTYTKKKNSLTSTNLFTVVMTTTARTAAADAKKIKTETNGTKCTEAVEQRYYDK